MFEQLSLWVNIGLFTLAAVAVWIAGTRVAHWADAIAHKTGIGQAAVGLLLLAGVTSLPEVAVTITAAVGGNAQLAVNNLLGSVAMQVAILAVADAVIGKDALTAVLPDPRVLMQIALNMLVLGVVAAAVVVGDHGIWGVGVWSIGLLGLYLASVWILTRAPGRQSWVIGNAGADAAGDRDAAPAQGQGSDEAKAQLPHERLQRLSLSALVLRTAAGAAVILVAGFVLSRSGEVDRHADRPRPELGRLPAGGHFDLAARGQHRHRVGATGPLRDGGVRHLRHQPVQRRHAVPGRCLLSAAARC